MNNCGSRLIDHMTKDQHIMMMQLYRYESQCIVQVQVSLLCCNCQHIIDAIIFNEKKHTHTYPPDSDSDVNAKGI